MIPGRSSRGALAFSTINIRLYCDESGNSGSNYLDPQQPIHVLAGACVDSEAEADLERLIADLRGQRGCAEVHALKWLKTSSGRRSIVQFLRQVGRLKIVPLFYVAEKRFAIAAKIVETFFDPFHNERAAWLPTGANVDRESLAQSFYKLPNAQLEQFALAYRNPTVESFQAVIQSLAAFCELLPNHQPHLAWTLRGNLSELGDLVRTESLQDSSLRHPIMTSLNVPIFAQFVRMADAFLSLRPDTSAEVIHDETSEFEPVFRYFFDAMVGVSDEAEPYLLQDGTPINFGLSRLRNFRTASSHVSPGVQLADIFASSVRYVIGSAWRDDEWDDSTKALALFTLPMFLFDEVQIAGHLTSDEFRMKVFKRVLTLAPDGLDQVIDRALRRAPGQQSTTNRRSTA